MCTPTPCSPVPLNHKVSKDAQQLTKKGRGASRGVFFVLEKFEVMLEIKGRISGISQGPLRYLRLNLRVAYSNLQQLPGNLQQSHGHMVRMFRQKMLQNAALQCSRLAAIHFKQLRASNFPNPFFVQVVFVARPAPCMHHQGRSTETEGHVGGQCSGK